MLRNLVGLMKVHMHECPVRLIVAAYESFNFSIGKQPVPLISQLAVNPYILKYSYDFANTLRTLSYANNSFMCSLVINSLFTSIHTCWKNNRPPSK